MKIKRRSQLLVVGLMAGVSLSPAVAQDIAAGAADSTATIGDDIIVTARKRDETSISIPVSITALGQRQIEEQGIRDFSDIAAATPGLTVADATGGLGGSIVLRGVGTAPGSNPSFDQTVAIVLDGVPVSRGNAVRMGQYDMAQIEVLNGPQALFFGKNSPAGVISITTADPGDEFEMMLRGGYEFYAREKAIDAVVSVPIGSVGGIRLAGSYSDSEGWMTNDAFKALPLNAVIPGVVVPPSSRGAQRTEHFGRATLLLEPNDRLKIRGKISYTRLAAPGLTGSGSYQRFSCPAGVPNLSSQAPVLGAALPLAQVDDCTPNNHFTQGSISPASLASGRILNPNVDDPLGERDASLLLGSLELGYDIVDGVNLTSISGYVDMKDGAYQSFSYGPTDTNANVDFAANNDYKAFTQEVRLTTSFPDSRINGLLGFFYEDSELQGYSNALGVTNVNYLHLNSGKHFSVFGQLIAMLTDQVELAGGARWSREKKEYDVLRNGVSVPLAVNEATFTNLSPEATLSWRPTQNFTAYVAYRSGFKSGGFANPAVSLTPLAQVTNSNNLFRPEKAKGFEIGAKALLADGAVRLNLAAYRTKYTDLQVNSIDNSSGTPVIRVTNAAAALIQGIEGSVLWKPDTVEGLELRATGNYNDARYEQFIAACFIGQTAAEGCFFQSGLAVQDLEGAPLLNAPKWTGSLGFSYRMPVANDRMALLFSSDLVYKSRTNPHPDIHVDAWQAESAMLNASIRLDNEENGWQIGIFGRNLTDVYRILGASNVPGNGVATTLANLNVVGRHSDLVGSVNRGREIWFQLTLRPSSWLR